MRPPPLRTKLGLAALSALIALTAVEAVSRRALPLEPALKGRIFVARLPDGRAVELPSMPMLHGAQTSDPKLPFELAPSLSFEIHYDAGGETTHPYMRVEDGWFVLDVETNAAAMRGPLPLAEPAPGRPRVACVGDSFTFGDGVRFEDTWVAGLEQAFRDAGGGTPLEVLDFGVPGYESGDIAEQLKSKVLPGNPDLVIYGLVLNDPPSRHNPELERLGKQAEAALVETLQPPTGLARYLHLAALVQARARTARLEAAYRRFVRARFAPTSASWTAFTEDLAEMRAATSAAGSKLLVCIFPLLDSLTGRYPFTPEHKEIAAACDGLRIPVVDLLPAFDGQPADTLWVHPTDQHPNPHGHALARDWIARELVRRQASLLPH